METLRGHTRPVTSVGVSADGDWCYTGSADATIRVWKMPSLTKEKYDKYGENPLKGKGLSRHSDSHWALPRYIP